MNTNKNKLKISKKNITRMNINKDENNSIYNKNNNINFGTVTNENTAHLNKKIKNYKNKSSSIGDKVSHKKRNVNKSQ
jgi:chorismate synthase